MKIWGVTVAIVRLEYRHVLLGQPLDFDVIDEQERILLIKGYVIRSEEQLDRLIMRGVFFKKIIDETVQLPQEDNNISVFLQIGELANRFDTLIDKAAMDCGEVLDIAGRIQELCESDSDAALANIQLQKAGRYSLRHSFHAAVLTEILLARLECPAAVRRHAVAGALTMNIGMLELQDVFYHQDAPLTSEQKRCVIVHPQMATKALREQGIDHPVWLDVVEHHHEMIDGSGYSKRLLKCDLSIESQTVSLADRYCAMVSKREYRAGLLPSMAAKDLLVRQSATIEPALAAAFLKEVGLYPPGTVVALVNSEVGVVVRRLLNPAQPVVRGLRSASGIRYAELPKRLTSKANYAIKEALSAEMAKDFDLSALWDPVPPDEMDI